MVRRHPISLSLHHAFFDSFINLVVPTVCFTFWSLKDLSTEDIAKEIFGDDNQFASHQQ